MAKYALSVTFTYDIAGFTVERTLDTWDETTINDALADMGEEIIQLVEKYYPQFKGTV